jgi:hypothetical protein
MSADVTDNINDELIDAGAVTPTATNEGGLKETLPSNEEKLPYKSFSSKEEFDKHSLGILNSAKAKAEKEILALLGLNGNEKDKLSKFREAYEQTLTESEKQAQTLEALTTKVSALESELSEKKAIIQTLSNLSGKNEGDVLKYVKMAKGLVDENTTMEQALTQVMEVFKTEIKPTVPAGKPLQEPTQPTSPKDNVFMKNNLTEQARLISMDREEARNQYKLAYGKMPNW